MKALAKASQVIRAPRQVIFEILMDPDRHRLILPAAFFDYGPESKDGDIIRFSLRNGPFVKHFRMKVEVIEPNRTIHEYDLATGYHTAFHLESQAPGSTEVTISTAWESAAGLAGMIEATLAPIFLRKLYTEELGKLAAYVASMPDTENTA